MNLRWAYMITSLFSDFTGSFNPPGYVICLLSITVSFRPSVRTGVRMGLCIVNFETGLESSTYLLFSAASDLRASLRSSKTSLSH